MSSTPNLGLPYIDAGQAQKHVTHNEALRALDTLVQLAVLDRDLTAPPSSPAEGQRWIVKAGATDAWAGYDNEIAAWQDGAWQFSTPVTGWIAYIADEEILTAWDGADWSAVSGGGGSDPTELQNMTLLGVGTTADATNPLNAKLNNALWTAKTVAEGGDGDLRYKLSKEGATNTLSLLLQDNFTGCAEIGLTGDDDFHFKVSPDGTSWLEALKIERATGKVSFPLMGGPRETLTANRTYYVRTDGSDSNTGLANTAGGAFVTLQKAFDICTTLDFNGFTVTVQLADGTYTAGATIGKMVGQATGANLVIMGNLATPANVVISSATGSCIRASGGMCTVQGVKLNSATAGFRVGLQAELGANIRFAAVDFGACSNAHIYADKYSIVQAMGNFTISGAAPNFAQLYDGGQVVVQGRTLTITGTPAFSDAFISINRMSLGIFEGNTYSGSATGIRYKVTNNSVVSVGGAGTAVLPGDAIGSVTTGGQYL